MMNQDYLVKALAFEDNVRIYAIRSTEMVKEAARRQGTWRTVTAALGRAMSAGTMMGAMLKGDEKLTIKIEGNGPSSPIVIDATARGTARGYLNQAEIDPARREDGKLNVSAVVGNEGTLSVVKDLGMRDHFTGSVPLVSGEIGDDFTYYFASSEQTPSSVALGVLIGENDDVQAAGGFIVQLMPGASDDMIDVVEQSLTELPPVSTMVNWGKTPEEIVEHISGANNYRIIETVETKFQCHCSKERITNALYGIDGSELKAMIEEDEGAETICQFCNEIYNFSKQELEEIQAEREN